MPTNPDTDYQKAHAEIDQAIADSVHESPASIGEIAETLDNRYNKMLIRRRFLLDWVRRGKRWERREDE